MPGTETLGKLFFKLFFERFGSQNSLQPKSKQTRQTPWNRSVYRLKASRLEPACAAAPSRQENNPAETVATARRIRRAPPAQNRGGADSERVRSHLQNRA